MFLCGRAEELGRDKEYRETFDLVTCRAVAQLSTALELCSSFAKPRAIVVAYKGQQASEELEGRRKRYGAALAHFSRGL